MNKGRPKASGPSLQEEEPADNGPESDDGDVEARMRQAEPGANRDGAKTALARRGQGSPHWFRDEYVVFDGGSKGVTNGSGTKSGGEAKSKTGIEERRPPEYGKEPRIRKKADERD